VLSAADDGLLCVFDVTIAGEEDALVTVLNAEGAIARFAPFGRQAAFIFIITRTDRLSLWSLGSADRIAEFGALRQQLSSAGLPLQYLIDCHHYGNPVAADDGRLELLIGSHSGELAAFDVTPTTVAPTAVPADSHSMPTHGVPFIFSGIEPAHTNTVRSAAWSKDHHGKGIMYTGGEDGRICQWAAHGGEHPAAPSNGHTTSFIHPAVAAATASSTGPVRAAAGSNLSKFFGRSSASGAPTAAIFGTRRLKREQPGDSTMDYDDR
jgi:hypothetical protein